MDDEAEELLALTTKKNLALKVELKDSRAEKEAVAKELAECEAKCMALKCELQEALASKEAYMNKLKERTKIAKECEKDSKDLRGRVVELEAEVAKVNSMNATLEDKIQEFVCDREGSAAEEVIEAQDIIQEMKRQEERYKVRLLQLEAKDEEIGQLKEIITHLQERSPSREITSDEKTKFLEKENARLTNLVMEMKKTEADNMNKQTEYEKKVKEQGSPEAPYVPPLLFTPRGHKPSASLEERFRRFVKKKTDK